MNYDEPWSVVVIEGVEKIRFKECFLPGSGFMSTELRHRIVACINFCAGVSNEGLKELVSVEAMSTAYRNLLSIDSNKSRPILPPALLEALQAYVEARIELAMAGNEVGADGYGVSTVDERQNAEATWQAVLAANEVKP